MLYYATKRVCDMMSAETAPKKRGGGGNAHLAELSEVDLERLCVVFEPERDHRVQDVLAANRLALLELALLRRFGRDKADELRHALLHALLGVLRYFRRWWHGVLHDARDICDLRVPTRRRRRDVGGVKSSLA